MSDYQFGGVMDAPGAFTYVADTGGTDPGPTIDEDSQGLPNVTVGQKYIYNGGRKEAVEVNDSDAHFVEGDTNGQVLAKGATINGTYYPAETQITSTGEITFRDAATGDTYILYIGAMDTASIREASESDFYVWKNGIAPVEGTELTVIARGQQNSIPYSDLPAPCFCGGTLIDTPLGPIPVEDLAVGDLVNTSSGEAMPIRWIGARDVTAEMLRTIPGLQPVVITAGSLGPNIPAADLILSRQHRVRISSAITKDITGSTQALVPAIKLLGVPGIDAAENIAPFTYYHLLLDTHSCVSSNGAWTESLYLGEQFLGSLSSAGRAELKLIFPELFSDDFCYLPAAQFISRRKMVDRIVADHLEKAASLH